jgi:hypothetical protein
MTGPVETFQLSVELPFEVGGGRIELPIQGHLITGARTGAGAGAEAR